jgi:hypothetical protein
MCAALQRKATEDASTSASNQSNMGRHGFRVGLHDRGLSRLFEESQYSVVSGISGLQEESNFQKRLMRDESWMETLDD